MHKKLLLLILVALITSNAAKAQREKLRGHRLVAISVSQQPEKVSSKSQQTLPATQISNNANKNSAPGSLGTQIGKTYYDLPTNGAMGNRILRHPDGTVSAVWNEECNPNTGSTGYLNRGAGYNYFNGTTWIHGSTPSGAFNGTCNEPAGTNGPEFGVASQRVGWPEITGLRNGKELIFTHGGNGINITSRPAKGTGGMAAWSSTTDIPFTQYVLGFGNNGSWPRVANAGDTIHLVYALNKNVGTTGLPPQPVINGVTHPMVYSRSVDGGLTWDKQNIFLPGMTGIINPANPGVINPEGFQKIGTDNYAIAVNGATVAIVTGDFGQAWTLWKSTDNGTTFTRRVISRITNADTILINALADTVAFVNDKNHAITIDNNGVVHVLAGEILIKVATRNNGSTFLTGSDWYPNSGRALLYWNDALPTGAKPVTIAGIEDSQPLTGLDWIADGFSGLKGNPYGTTGLVSIPTVAIDNSNNIYVVYAAAVEGTSNNGSPNGQPYRDLYVLNRFAGGTWSNSRNISRAHHLFPNQPGKSTAENNEESVFPSLAPRIGADGYLHLIFQKDNEPGTSIGPDLDPETENAIMYLKWNPSPTLAGISENHLAILNDIQTYPNPTTGKTTLRINLKRPASISVSIKDLQGKEITSFSKNNLLAGKNQLPLDLSRFPKGMYLYTVTSEDFSVTKKIILH